MALLPHALTDSFDRGERIRLVLFFAAIALIHVVGWGLLLSIAPQILAEFIHVVTDRRRFAQPLDMNAARQVAEQWWTAKDIVRVRRWLDTHPAQR